MFDYVHLESSDLNLANVTSDGQKTKSFECDVRLIKSLISNR